MIVTFLLTDIEGSSRQWEENSDGMRRALRVHDRLVAAAVRGQGGTVLTTHGEGDSIFAVFPRAAEAVAAARAIQCALGRCAWPAGRWLRVRMALHSGRVGQDFRGPAANRCARIRACAHGGQVLLSAATAELVASTLPHGTWLLDLGYHLLRDLGPERIYQLVAPGLPFVFPPLRSPAPQALRQLPPDLADFTGRAAEVAGLRALLSRGGDAPPICAITGKPGVGKSALAVHLAHLLADQFPDAQLYADLRGSARAAVLTGFLRALAVPAEGLLGGPDELAALYRSLLAGRRALVVLDNAEDERQVRALLPGSPTCAVLVTSRPRPTALAGAELWELDDLSCQESVALLGRVAGAGRVEREPATAARIACLCGGLPLALRIAGAILRRRPHWRVARLAERLADERGRLSQLRAGDLDLRSSFADSYRRLSDAEARVFRLLSLLPGPDFSAGKVAALVGCRTREAEDVLERLCDEQLLLAPSARRYRFHELIRLYSRDRLEAEEPPAARSA